MVVESGTTGTGGGAGAGGSTGASDGTTGGGVASSAAASDKGAAPGTAVLGAGEGDADPVVPKAYAPNLKYKVLREEKELPEWARPFVTSQDLEKNFRDVFERADGIEAVKQHRDSLVSENAAMREQWAPHAQTVATANQLLQSGDLHSFLQFAGIPEMAILKYAHQRISLRESGQAQAHDDAAQLRLQNIQLQNQLNDSQSGYQNIAVQTREFQLDAHLARAETQPAVQAFDARVGKPGAFRNEVIRRGQAYAAMGQDVSVDQAANEVLQLIGWSGQNPAAAPVQNGAGAATNPPGAEPPAQRNLPTLPNFKGKGGSPIKKVPKSTDELRQLARSLR